MKTITFLLAFLLTFLSFSAGAANFVQCPNDVCPVAGTDPVRFYSSAANCGSNCYILPAGVPYAVCTLMNVQVPDASKPILKQDAESCSDSLNCESVVAGKTCTDPSGVKVWRPIPNSSPIAYEAYCAVTQMKTVKQLKVDSVKVAAAATAATTAATEAAAKAAKQASRLPILIACAKLTVATATRNQLDACNLQVIREVVRDKLSAAEQ